MTSDEFRQHLATVACLAEEREDASNVAVEVERRLESLRKEQLDLSRKINHILSNLAPILDRIPEGEAVEVDGYAFWADSEGPAICLLRRPHTLAPILAEIEREEEITDEQIDDAAIIQALADVDRAFPDQAGDEWCPKCGKGIEQPTPYGRIHLDACHCGPKPNSHEQGYLECSDCKRGGWSDLVIASAAMTYPCQCGGRWRMIPGPEAVRTALGSIHIRNGSEEL